MSPSSSTLFESPFDEPMLLSASPPKVRGVSPTRNTPGSPTNSIERALRVRNSPTLTRSFDPNDPDARERQRTMDVDMALQLCRARRETVVLPSSPFDGPRPETAPLFDSFSAVEQHDLELARGEDPHALDHVTIHGDAPVTVSGSPIPLGLRLNDTRDNSLFSPMEAQYARPSRQDPSSSMPHPPRYQLSSPRSVFDFALLEDFAVREKESLGIAPGSPTIRVAHFVKGHGKNNGRKSPSLPGGVAFDLSEGTTAIPRRAGGARQRKLSESAPVPRPHHRTGRGKVALFEHQTNQPIPGFQTRLIESGQRSVDSSPNDGVSVVYRQVRREQVTNTHADMLVQAPALSPLLIQDSRSSETHYNHLASDQLGSSLENSRSRISRESFCRFARHRA